MMGKIVSHSFPLASAIMFQAQLWRDCLFVTCVSASCTNPGPAVCTLLGLFLCCAMPFAGTGTSPDQDDNVMPVFRDK